MPNTPNTERARLEPCPFCGAHEKVWVQNGDTLAATGAWRLMIWCEVCCARTGEFDTSAEAIEAWNTRSALTHARSEGIEVPAELRELSERATVGPWVVDPVMAWVSPTFDHDLPICAMRMETDGVSAEEQAKADAALIVAAVNFIRSLTSLRPAQGDK